MISKAEIDILLGALGSLLSMLESIDPALASSKAVIDIKAAIGALKGLGL